jgi:hypothetical protein
VNGTIPSNPKGKVDDVIFARALRSLMAGMRCLLQPARRLPIGLQRLGNRHAHGLYLLLAGDAGLAGLRRGDLVLALWARPAISAHTRLKRTVNSLT